MSDILCVASQPSEAEVKWEDWKDVLHDLYIVQGLTLNAVRATMRLQFRIRLRKTTISHDFEKQASNFTIARRCTGLASSFGIFEKNSYRSRHPNLDSSSGNIPIKGPRTRPRRRKSQTTSLSRSVLLRQNIQPMPRMPQMPITYQRQHEVVLATSNYIAGLFDTHLWKSDIFHLQPPPGMVSHAQAWQKISDETFGVKTLLSLRSQETRHRAFRTLNEVCAKILSLLIGNDLTIMVKLWYIFLALHQAFEIQGDYQILLQFLNYLNGLASNKLAIGHPLRAILTTLRKILNDGHHEWHPENFVREALRIGYLRTIEAIEENSVSGNAVVLYMRSHYIKTFGGQGVLIHRHIQQFHTLLKAAEADLSPEGQQRTVEVLHKYLYAAYYNACDMTLSAWLAEQLLHRAVSLPCLQESPVWCLATQGYALAVKVRAMQAWQSGDREAAQTYLQNAVGLLERGDAECQTRSIMLADLARKYG